MDLSVEDFTAFEGFLPFDRNSSASVRQRKEIYNLQDKGDNRDRKGILLELVSLNCDFNVLEDKKIAETFDSFNNGKLSLKKSHAICFWYATRFSNKIIPTANNSDRSLMSPIPHSN